MVSHVEWTSTNPLFRLWFQSFQILVYYRMQITVNILRQDGEWQIYPDILDILVREDWYQYLVCYAYYHRLSEKLLNFRFAQIFNNWCFTKRNDYTWAQNPLIPKWKPKRSDHKGLPDQNVCFLPRIKGFCVKFNINIIHVCVTFCSVVLGRSSEVQTKQQSNMWSNQSIYQWCISATEHSILHSS